MENCHILACVGCNITLTACSSLSLLHTIIPMLSRRHSIGLYSMCGWLVYWQCVCESVVSGWRHTSLPSISIGSAVFAQLTVVPFDHHMPTTIVDILIRNGIDPDNRIMWILNVVFYPFFTKFFAIIWVIMAGLTARRSPRVDDPNGIDPDHGMIQWTGFCSAVFTKFFCNHLVYIFASFHRLWAN